MELLHIGAVQLETGLSKDTLRKWEQRYGFPNPMRDAAGRRLYSRQQIQRLLEIKRLLKLGFRPGKVIGSAAGTDWTPSKHFMCSSHTGAVEHDFTRNALTPKTK